MSNESTSSRSLDMDDERKIPDRSYRNPPVMEALCEIYFAESAWDDTAPGAFYERVKNDFPKKQQKEIQEATITMGPEISSAGVQRLPSWMQFLTKNGDQMIQVAENLLVVNQLLPYRHFEDWEQVVYKAFTIYNEIAPPQRITRIGLRYINRIEIPGEKIAMEDFFTIYPKLPQSLGNIHGPFLVRVEVPQAEQGHTVFITFGTPDLSRPFEGKQTFMLDLYDRATQNESLDKTELKKEVQLAHENVVLAFEDSITDQLRDLLNMEGKE